ncbi:GAF and ANTAR domain-containing protein [Kineococcus rubinsiae]|uniref:GAF and ANTAR domain-containing protein n=1 Tax=Kineococcus rubinsiae TaxID=2609562 RepID=UPI0014319645|nr:GAF and ANTAR domain-containing protein [Kineococcus rubinsiae]NIZ90389.1 GAF and ANTAR domain-containing protein [Kineococcus rubinsiae]
MDETAGGQRDVRPSHLVDALADLARQMQQKAGTEDTLEKVVTAAIALIPGAEEGSISVVTGRTEVESWAASSDLPRGIDALQSKVAEGPCLDAAFDAKVVDAPDMSTESRWPHFAQQASEMGVGAMMSFRLFISGNDLGAMNLYNRAPHAFDEESRQIGLPFVAHAAVALAQALQRTSQQTAMDSRDLIGQAKGILMERHKLSAAQAFNLLITVSQHRNVKLRDIAEELTSSGQLVGPRGSI